MNPVILIAALLAAMLFALALGGKSGRLKRLHKLMQSRQAAVSAPREIALPEFIARNLRLLGITPGPRELWATLTVFALPVILAGLFLNLFFAIALAAAMALVGYAALNVMAARRLARLGGMMPGFFDRVRQLLAIGNSLPTAFTRAVQGAQPELSGFFAPALRRIGNGAGVADSIQQSAQDIDLQEMRLFAAAITVNMRFGGSLAHALGNLVGHLRKRAAIERELRSDTSQIRASAWVLGLLPALVAVLIMSQNRDYARWFLVHPAGHEMLAYCLASQIAGAVLMRKIVRTGF